MIIAQRDEPMWLLWQPDPQSVQTTSPGDVPEKEAPGRGDLRGRVSEEERAA